MPLASPIASVLVVPERANEPLPVIVLALQDSTPDTDNAPLSMTVDTAPKFSDPVVAPTLRVVPALIVNDPLSETPVLRLTPLAFASTKD
jgi:hypothetical protein